MKARLLGSREIAPWTHQFEFEAPEWDGHFEPGQFMSLTANIGGAEVTRAYSIASAPAPATRSFALCANHVPDGRFTPYLFSLAPGAEVDFKGPYGAFVARRPPADSILVATGTGIAPFRSMLPALPENHPDRQFTLVFGVRHLEGLLYDEELRALAARLPNFDYRPTLTRPTADWKGRTGRVQSHVLEVLGDRRDMDVYICGLREMVDELRTQLKAGGLDRKRIIFEKYD
jgi:ferredoxin-NADP reductase